MEKKAKKEFDEATRASIMKEMAKPRMAKSARKKNTNLALLLVGPKKKIACRETQFEGKLLKNEQN